MRRSVIEGLQRVYQSLSQNVEDTSSAEETLESLRDKGRGSSMLLPLRGGVFVKAELETVDEILVSFDDVAIEGDLEEALEELGDREEDLRGRMEEVHSSLGEERKRLQELQSKAQSLATGRGSVSAG